jgi:hypothetical protein
MTGKSGGEEGAKFGAEAGLAVAAGCSYLFFLFCAPVTVPIGIVAGAIGGSVWGSINESRPPLPQPPREPPHSAAANGPRWTHLSLVGTTDGSGPMPAGTLYVGTTEYLGDRHKKWLVVDLAQPTLQGERSFVAATVPNCWTGKLTLAYQVTYAGALGEGELVGSRLYQPQMEITEPNEVLVSAIRSICSFGDKVKSAAKS